MKVINVFLKFIAIVAFVLLINPIDSTAQKDRPAPQNDDKVADRNQVATYCDDQISKTYSELEIRANKTCNSEKATVQCNDRNSGRAVYVTVIAKPAPKGCKATVKVQKEIVEVRNAVSRGGAINSNERPSDSDERTGDVAIEILQKPCHNGGMQLTAYIPGDNNVREQYDFAWKADDKEIAREMVLQCTSEKEVTLDVTDRTTDRTTTVRVSLDSAVSAKNK